RAIRYRGQTIFQTHASKGINAKIIEVRDPADKDDEPYVAIEDLDGLIGLVSRPFSKFTLGARRSTTGSGQSTSLWILITAKASNGRPSSTRPKKHADAWRQPDW